MRCHLRYSFLSDAKNAAFFKAHAGLVRLRFDSARRSAQLMNVFRQEHLVAPGQAFVRSSRKPGQKYVDYGSDEVKARLEAAFALTEKLESAAGAGKRLGQSGAVAQLEGFPKTTFARKYKQWQKDPRTVFDVRSGAPTALPPATEKRLTRWVQECAVRGFPQMVSTIRLRAKQLLAKEGGRFQTKSPAGLPSYEWFEGLQRRHHVELFTPAALSSSRAKAADPKVIESLFANVVAIAKAKNIAPNRWVGADETRFGKLIGRSRRKVAVPRGIGEVKILTNDFFTQHLSLMMGYDTSGRFLVPMWIFQVCAEFLRLLLSDVSGQNVRCEFA